MTVDVKNLVKTFANLRPSSTFLSIKEYQNNDGEVSNFGLVFHVSYLTLLNKSLAIAEKFNPSNELESQAKLEILQSLKNSIDKVKTTPIEEVDDAYHHFADDAGNFVKGVKLHKNTGELHLYGYQIHKEVLIPGVYKKVNSKPLTLAKRAIEKQLPVKKWRQFKLTPEKFREIKVEGIVINSDIHNDLIEVLD